MAFASWDEVLAHVDGGAKRLVYHAPLDPHPVVVWVARRFKNGHLRLVRAGVRFTVDAGHLDRISKEG